MKPHKGIKLNTGYLYYFADRGLKDYVTLYKKYVSYLERHNIFLCTVKEYMNEFVDSGGQKHSIETELPYLKEILQTHDLCEAQKDSLSFAIKRIEKHINLINNYSSNDVIIYKRDIHLNDKNYYFNLCFYQSIYKQNFRVCYGDIEFIEIFRKNRDANRLFRYVKAILENHMYSYNTIFGQNVSIPHYFETFFQRN